MEPKVLQNSDSEAESISEHILSSTENTSDKVNTPQSVEASDIPKKSHSGAPEELKVSSGDSWSKTISKDEHISSESSIQLPSSLSEQMNVSKSVSKKDEDPPLVRDSLDRDMKEQGTCSDHSVSGQTSNSEELIKLDIRGTAVPKINLPIEKIIIGPPPIEFLSNAFFPTAELSLKAELDETLKQEKYFDSIEHSDDVGQCDRLVEEITVDNSFSKDDHKSDLEFTPLSTMSTDYKTVCGEYYTKIVKLEDVVAQKEKTIQELLNTLQRTDSDFKNMHEHNNFLTAMVTNLRQKYGDAISSDSDLLKDNISDFMKNESFVQGENSTKFFSAIMSSGKNSGQSSLTPSDKDVEADEIIVNHSHSSSEKAKNTSELSNLFKNLPEKLTPTAVSVLKKDIDNYLSSCIREVQQKHATEMDNLRMYFENKCQDMEKNYSEEVSASAVSADGCDSLDVCAALALSSPFRTVSEVRARSRSVDALHDSQQDSKDATLREQEIEKVKAEHLNTVNEMVKKHNTIEKELRDQVAQLKAHIQTADNTETLPTYVEDIDMALEKGVQANMWEQQLHEAKQEVIHHLLDQIKALLSDPDAEVTSWPQELVALRERIHSDAHQTIARMKQQHEEELSTLRAELGGGGFSDSCSQQWRQRRNSTFDKNRQLEEVTKERDGLKKMTRSFQHIVAYLIQYFSDCEHEINKTVLADIALAANALDITLDSRQCTPDSSFAISERRVHIAPDISSLLTEEAIEQVYKEQRDLSLEIRRELEMSLNRLKQEADDILQISTRIASTRKSLGPPAGSDEDENKIDNDLKSQEKIGDSVQECDNCRAQKKELENVLTESFDRELTLRKELEESKLKLAQLTSDMNEEIFVAEGIGTTIPISQRDLQINTTWSPRSLDSPRLHQLNELEAITRERDDLSKQLDAANRQLRKTRAFLEEQTEEREAERKENSEKLKEAKNAVGELKTKLQLAQGASQHVDQLESQLKDMNVLVGELEEKKSQLNDELRSSNEKITMLRDIISNLETQLEQKAQREGEIIRQLEEMRRTIDERDDKMRLLVGELENLRLEVKETSRMSTPDKSAMRDDHEIEEQVHQVVSYIRSRAAQLEREAAAPAPPGAISVSEDISPNKVNETNVQKCIEPPELCGPLAHLTEGLTASWRAECVAIKAIADHRQALNALKEITQEVRAERDVLQTRMAEQALRISDLTARLQMQRESAQALRDEATAELTVKLHDALADNERLTYQGLVRGPNEQFAYLEKMLEESKRQIVILQHEIKEKDQYIRDIMSIKLKDEDHSPDANDATKNSARTLSDIISLSDFDEQDMQMRRADPRLHGTSLDGVPYPNLEEQNATLPPKPQISFIMEKNSLDHLDLATFTTPKDKSRVKILTSTVTKHFLSHDTPAILENCSMFPNRNADETENISPDPKKINFSDVDHSFIENQIAGVYKDLCLEGEGNIKIPDAIIRLKEEIIKLRENLNEGEALANANELPLVKAELDEIKATLQTNLQNIQSDKEFFNNKLKSHLDSENELKRKLKDKDSDLKLIKEELIKRENTVIELAREKRNLQAKLEEYEVECDTLRRLEHEKNLQIDGLNSHLIRLDDLQKQVDTQTDSMNDVLNKMQILKCERDEAVSCKNIASEKLSKVEKELENSKLKYKDAISEVERLSVALSEALDDTKRLSDEIHDRDCQIQILNEDTVAFHNELDSLRRQLNGERLPSPRCTDSPKSSRLSNDKKELVRIRKQVSFMQQELTYNKKELNEKVFEVERLKLDLNELRNELGRSQRRATELQDTLQARDQHWHNNDQALQRKEMSLQTKERQLQDLIKTVEQQMEYKQRELENELVLRRQEVMDRERLLDQLHNQLQDLEEENAELRKNLIMETQTRSPLVSAVTPQRGISPTAELERSLKRELNASKRLDTSLAILLSPERTAVPKLTLPSRSSSARSCSPGMNLLAHYVQPIEAEQITAESERLAAENERLTSECERASEERVRLTQERDALAARSQSLQSTVAELHAAMERTQVEDQNTIIILKQRLQTAMQSEEKLREELTSVRLRLQSLKSSLEANKGENPNQIKLDTQMRENVRLESEVSLLRGKLERGRRRISELQTELYNERVAKMQNAQKIPSESRIPAEKENPQNDQVASQQAASTSAAQIVETMREEDMPSSDTDDDSQQNVPADTYDDKNCIFCTMKTKRVGSTRQRTIKATSFRYLHSRCLRLESCRKGLVWQKRFLVRSLDSYHKEEDKLNLPKDKVNRFRCAALCVMAFIRMGWLVKRNRAVRTISRNTILIPPQLNSTTKEHYNPDRGNLRKNTLRRSSSLRNANFSSNITTKSNSSLTMHQMDSDSSEVGERLGRVNRKLRQYLDSPNEVR